VVAGKPEPRFQERCHPSHQYTRGRQQGINLPGRDAADIRLHDHAIDGLIDAVAVLQDRGQVTARAQFGDHQVMSPTEVARLLGL
jgi:hypothetical protein